MDLITLNFKKSSPFVNSPFDETGEILGPVSDTIENIMADGRADTNSITNGALTLTFGSMGVETLNGEPFTNELLWFNSSQGGDISTDSRPSTISFDSRPSTFFKVMVLNLDFMCFDQIKPSQFQFRIVQM